MYRAFIYLILLDIFALDQSISEILRLLIILLGILLVISGFTSWKGSINKFYIYTFWIVLLSIACIESYTSELFSSLTFIATISFISPRNTRNSLKIDLSFMLILGALLFVGRQEILRAYLLSSRGAISEAGMSVFALGIIGAIIAIYSVNTRLSWVIKFILIVISLFLLYTSKSRGPVVAMLVSLFVMYWGRMGIGTRIITVLASSSLITTGFILRGESGLESIVHRLDLMMSSPVTIKTIFVGNGLGSVFTRIYYPHNWIVHLFYEIGFFFTLLLVLKFAQIIYILYRRREIDFMSQILLLMTVWYLFSGMGTSALRVIIPFTFLKWSV